MDPVKIGEVDEHITCDSDALRSVKDQTVADNMVSEKLDTADINTCIVEKHDLISNNDAQSTDKVVISDEVETLKPVKIETFDHTVEAPDLEASSIKHSNSELKSQENDMLQNLGPYPSPQSQNLMPYPIAQSQNLVPYPILQSNLQSQNFNPNAQSRIIDPLYVTREREVLVREKCDEFSCVNQGKFVDNGTVYRNKQPYDCRLGSSGPRWEKG